MPRAEYLIYKALRRDEGPSLPRAEPPTLQFNSKAHCSKALCSPCSATIIAAPMGHGQTVRQHRGNANRRETYPPAVHADARHCAEPAATAPATGYSLSRFDTPPPLVPHQRCCEDCRRQRCGPWCDPTLAFGLRRGTAQSSGAPPRRFRPLRSQAIRWWTSALSSASMPGT